ncbi:MAG: AraC family transcriptional regulator [Rikenellaceae bacterium]|nr:AraC family transcriptional regulator [Rikenellaceae bacterium]
MAELFGRMPHDEAGFFVARRLDMRGLKIEESWPVIHSRIHCYFYLTGGEALMQIGEELCLFKAGECACIPAGQIFSVRYFDNCTGYMGGCSTAFVSDNGLNPIQSFGSLRRWGDHKVFFSETIRPYIQTIFERLCMEYESVGSQKMIKAYLILLLTEIEEASVYSAREVTLENSNCNRFIESVFRHCDLRIPVSDYAEQLGISQDYLQKIIKRITGKSPMAWIHEAVILQAKACLLSTDLAVGEISGRVGVEDPAYFSRLFKKHTGLTPLQYRKRQRSSNIPPFSS